MTENTTQPEDNAAATDPTEVRYLHPDTCRIHLGTHGALHVTTLNDRIYGGVYAAYAFPVAHPSGYISLLRAVDGTEREIGVIRNLDEFPPEQADLVKQALARRYFIHTITQIHEVKWKYGFVALDVRTDKGRVSFLLKWQQDRAVNFGAEGKMLIDVNDNRYVIPNLEKLTARERADFKRIIYW